MARTLVSGGGYYDLTGISTTGLGANGVTLAGWFRAANLTTGHIFCSARTSAQPRIYLQANGNSPTDAFTAGSYDGTNYRGDEAGAYSADVWHSGIGVFRTSTDREAYLDGVSDGNTTTSSNPTWDRFRVGTGGAANIDVAEIAMWNVALSSDERAALVAGYSPLFVRPQNLVVYFPLLGGSGASGAEVDWVSGQSVSITGSDIAVVDHPRIIYPRRRSMIFVPAAVSGAPTITALSAIGITATSAQPRISYS